MKTQVLQQIPSKAEFVSAYKKFLSDIIAGAVELGGMLVKMMEVNPMTIEELSQDGFSKETLKKLERIGHGSLDPRLLIDDSPGAEAILNLPVAQQRQLLDDGVAVGDVSDDGKSVQTVKPLTMVSQKEIKKVFREDGSPRPVDEQVSIAKAAQRHLRVLPAQRYEISADGEAVYVLEKTEFTLKDWIAIGERAADVQRQNLEQSVKGNQLKKK